MARGYRDSDSRRYFDWLYYAAIDLRAAKLLLDDDRCFNLVAFHCQQCAEKAFKGYLLWRRHRLYDGHNLPWLCKQAMAEDPHFEDRLQLASDINHYYIEARYPADFLLQLDSESATDLIVQTSDLLTFVDSLVKFDFQSYRQKKIPPGQR
ncbi:MAG: HEPN domain-containing protein [Oscillospiraceae bacterium]|nr:HEPN domain-containing protein [Oscillospiraceae bacterium]